MPLAIDLLSLKERLKTKIVDKTRFVWDDIRKKYYVLTPEETVRQLFILHLLENEAYPKNKIAVEKKITVLSRSKRFDIVVFDKDGKNTFMLIECKSPDVALTQDTINQVLSYNMTLQASYIAVTNGLETFCFAVHTGEQNPVALEHFPTYR